jgi:Domain of unknown function DUF1828
VTAPCDEVISAALAKVNDDWTCRPLDRGWLLVTTSHQYSDGDHVELLVRRDDQSVVVSDGGEALARLGLAGVSVDRGRVREMWRGLLRAHELEVHAERLSVQGTLNEVGRLVNNMANAVANIDGLRLLVASPRSPRFADRLVTFLQAEFEYVTEGPQLYGRSGVLYRPTAAVGGPNRQTFVQAVAGDSVQIRQRAVEHVFTMFSDVNGALPQERKLVILNEGEWRPEQTRLLSTVAYIGSWSYRDQIVGFVRDPVPRDSHFLVPVQEQAPFE